MYYLAELKHPASFEVALWVNNWTRSLFLHFVRVFFPSQSGHTFTSLTGIKSFVLVNDGSFDEIIQ